MVDTTKIPAILTARANNVISALKSVLGTAKIPLASAWKLIQETLANLVIVTEQEIGNTLAGPDKKAVVMQYANQGIQLIVSSISIPGLPAWVQVILSKWIADILTQLASGSIDAIVTTFHTTGVFTGTPTVPPTIPPVTTK